MKNIDKKYVVEYTIIGIIFGSLFPIGATITEILLKSYGFNFDSIALVHQGNSLIYMIDTAPIFLGLFAFVGGISRGRAACIAKHLEKYSLIVNQSPSSIFTIDTDGIIEDVNPKFEELLGYTRDEIIGKNIKIILGELPERNNCEEVWKTIEDGEVWKGEFLTRKKDGNFFWFDSSVAPLKDRNGKNLNYIILSNDITDRKCLEDRLRYHATIDAMTGAMTRRSGLDFLREKMNIAKESGDDLTICYVDINDLKFVNDNFGHKSGDNMITSVVKSIFENIRESDVISRLGGDEFLLVLPKCNMERATAIIERVIDDIGKKSKDLYYDISISYGFSEYSVEIVDTEKFITEADREMYKRKREIKKID